MRISAGFTGAIASAVAGEINRLEQHPDLWKSEGGAYKAALDRAGGNALNECDSFYRDCQVTALAAKFGRRLVIAATDAALIVERRRDLGAL